MNTRVVRKLNSRFALEHRYKVRSFATQRVSRTSRHIDAHSVLTTTNIFTVSPTISGCSECSSQCILVCLCQYDANTAAISTATTTLERNTSSEEERKKEKEEGQGQNTFEEDHARALKIISRCSTVSSWNACTYFDQLLVSLVLGCRSVESVHRHGDYISKDDGYSSYETTSESLRG